MKISSLTMPTALLLLTLIACNRASRHNDETPLAREVSADTVAISTAASDDQKVPGTDQAGNPAAVADHKTANPDWDKKIVKTANITLEVKRYKTFNALLHNAVRRFGGYIAQEEQNQSGYRIENTVTLKVPVEQFDDAVSQLSAVSDSDKLIGKKIASEDVSMEVVDTKSRMEAKREVLQRYMELLKQARNMNEILKVQNEIDEIQGQIEAAEGRIAYLSHSATFSTINLNYYEVLDETAQPDTNPSFFYKIRSAFSEGFDWLSNLLLGLVSIWPLLIAAFLAWLGYRRWRSSSRVKPAAANL